MIIHMDRLKDGEAESVSEDVAPGSFDLEFVDFHHIGNIRVKGTVEKNYQAVRFYGTLDRCVEMTCARCLKKVQKQIIQNVDHAYDIKGITTINLTDDIRDDLVLFHPDRFLCKENCKGLCPNCGIDRNTETCVCSQSVQEPVSELHLTIEGLTGKNEKRKI